VKDSDEKTGEDLTDDANRGERSQDGYSDADDRRNPVKPSETTDDKRGDENSPRDIHPEEPADGDSAAS
jgi:hypothetical protein